MKYTCNYCGHYWSNNAKLKLSKSCPKCQDKSIQIHRESNIDYYEGAPEFEEEEDFDPFFGIYEGSD